MTGKRINCRQRRFLQILAGIVLVALLVRLAVGFQLSGTYSPVTRPHPSTDTSTYQESARRIDQDYGAVRPELVFERRRIRRDTSDFRAGQRQLGQRRRNGRAGNEQHGVPRGRGKCDHGVVLGQGI